VVEGSTAQGGTRTFITDGRVLIGILLPTDPDLPTDLPTDHYTWICTQAVIDGQNDVSTEELDRHTAQTPIMRITCV